jgi:hypothetical protein
MFKAELKADSVLNKILSFKREKYGILRRAATKAAKPMVAALREAIKKSVGVQAEKAKAQKEYQEKRKQYERKKRNRKLAKDIGKALKPVSKTVSRWRKNLAKFGDNLIRKTAKNAFGIKLAKRSKTSTKPAKAEKVKLPKLLIPKKAKVPKPRKYGLHEIAKMIREQDTPAGQKELMREIIDNRKLLGGAANQKNGMVNTIGMTGGLAKSISFKISMAKPKRMAYDRETGEQIGGTGMTPADNARAWQNPKWKSVSAKRVILLVGATKRPMVAWNPFVKRLQKVNPKRYLHLVEGGHVLVVRKRKRGKVAGRHPLARTYASKKSQLISNVKMALKQELEKVLSKGGG